MKADDWTNRYRRYIRARAHALPTMPRRWSDGYAAWKNVFPEEPERAAAEEIRVLEEEHTLCSPVFSSLGARTAIGAAIPVGSR